MYVCTEMYLSELQKIFFFSWQLLVGDCNTCSEAAPLSQAGELDLHCPGCFWLQRAEMTSQMELFRQAEEMVSCQLRVPLAKMCALHQTCPAAQWFLYSFWPAEEPTKGPLDLVSMTSVVSVPSD